MKLEKTSFEFSQKDTIDTIQLKPVKGSHMCEYTVIENKLATLYENQEKILQAIKMLSDQLTHIKMFNP